MSHSFGDICTRNLTGPTIYETIQISVKQGGIAYRDSRWIDLSKCNASWCVIPPTARLSIFIAHCNFYNFAARN